MNRLKLKRDSVTYPVKTNMSIKQVKTSNKSKQNLIKIKKVKL